MRRWRTVNERSAFYAKVLTLYEGPPRRTLRDVGADVGLSAERVRNILKIARLEREAQK